MFIYTFFHIPTGDYELIFIGHRILFNAVKYANSLISFLLLFDGKLWHSKLTFFSFELKIWNSEHPQHPLVPVTGILWPLTSFLPPALCSGCPSLNCLTGQLMAGERECRLGPSFTEEGQLHSVLPQWNASSPGSGDSIHFFPSSGVGEHHLLRWSPHRMNMVGWSLREPGSAVKL